MRVDSKEVLLDDSREFARKAKLQGVDVQLDIWTGMWHAWTVVPFVPESKTALKKAGYKLYWLACGDADFAYPGAKLLHEALDRNGLKHTFHITGGGHTWSNWRDYLNTLAPMLFK